jgi:hypothetical protein
MGGVVHGLLLVLIAYFLFRPAYFLSLSKGGITHLSASTGKTVTSPLRISSENAARHSLSTQLDATARGDSKRMAYLQFSSASSTLREIESPT